ncbi:MAG: hypothetical protein ACI4BD_06095 [Paludibacteraceae bacterium]
MATTSQEKYYLFVLLTALLLCPAIIRAQYSDQDLYNAYLRRDMDQWKHYLDENAWQSLSLSEKKRYLNYEYGYIAPAIDTKKPWAEDYLKAFESHVEEMYQAKHISEAHYYMYMSSICAYDFMLNRGHLFSSGVKSLKHVKKATELAPEDPFVLTLMANVEFYAPSGLGGDKKEALERFSKARRLFETTTAYEHLWNYASMRLCIAQCYEKTGDVEKAVHACQEILESIPDFSYIRDEYLPKLQEQLAKK